jgi:hypothetical protein
VCKGRADFLLSHYARCKNTVKEREDDEANQENAADPAYQGRAIFGWVALGCAAATITAGLVVIPRPTIAVLILFIGGLVGSAAMSLFYINTFYVAALPLWWASALLICLRVFSSPPHRRPLRFGRRNRGS